MKMQGTKNNPSVSSLAKGRIKEEPAEINMTRRDFFGFFLMGGFLSLFSKKIKTVLKEKPKKALFWKRVNEK